MGEEGVIVTIVWIAVNDSNHPSDLMETRTNEPSDRHDQDCRDSTYNRGQNSLGQMFFALKETFPVCKLLPFTANAPPPPIAMLVAERRHTCQLIYEICISFQHCNGGWGDLNSKFPPKYKVYHEFCPRLSERVENFRGA